ncbi:two pore domain potassium channel family protein [Alteromonas pelagimontana]|uniref:Two pore domain potassium channel family protein n=1 Tax=Alteromonas pelagimontana TaxID=1858656 RepID=A0A6M4MCQ7_9ALTE|nr:ion channel [Alteromonas pelagimontana]QJR80345.1 two pore domain potassium channel family protein [Alteromonas pelagimontana]
MIYALLLSLVTVVLGVTLHLFNITKLADALLDRVSGNWVKTKLVLMIAIISQMLIAAIFTCSYVIGMKAGLGSFKSPAHLQDIFYFSLTTITTLGLGSIQPTHDLRMLAGVESATGFLLISCSAQRVFRAMNGER